MKESMTQREEGKAGVGVMEVAASTAAPSITLIQPLIILFSHTHTQFWGNILKDTEGEKRQN